MNDAKNAGDLATRCSEVMHSADAAAQMLGMAVARTEPGGAEVRMTVRSDMTNGHAVCHGGLIFALADTAFAHACNSRNQVTLAKSCDIDFLRPAYAADVLTATARESFRGGRTGVYDVDVVNQSGELVAIFRGRSHSTQKTLIED